MKKIKFKKTVMLDGKAVWIKDFTYDVIEEGTNNIGRRIYKLFGEDLKARGIDAAFADAGKICDVIEIKEEPKEEIKEKPKKVKKRKTTKKVENSKEN